MGQLVFQATLGGQVNLVGPNTASTYNINVPAVAGNMVTTGDTGTVTNTMCATSVYTAPGTIGSGTPNSGSFTSLAYSTTLTGGTGVVNLGSGQFYKDASGNVGIGTSSPTTKLNVANGAIRLTDAYELGWGANSVYVSGNSSTNNLLLYTNSAERMRIDSSGNVGIGTSSPTSKLYVSSTGAISGRFVSTQATNYLEVDNSGGGAGIASNGDALTFWTSVNGTERARIDSSGNVMFGITTAGSNGLSGFSFNSTTGPSNVWIGHTTGTASGTAYVGFNYNGTGIGSITQNGTMGVLYNMTSDYRLKNDQQPLTGAKEFVMALQPKKWQWWDGSGEGVGFIAHEFMEVAKYSGNGEKDAVDAEGKPIYQSIQPSSSEVMANLVSFIQEQQAIIEQLRADVETLKAK